MYLIFFALATVIILARMVNNASVQAISALHKLPHPTFTWVITHSATQHQSNQPPCLTLQCRVFCLRRAFLHLGFVSARVFAGTHCHFPPGPHPIKIVYNSVCVFLPSETVVFRLGRDERSVVGGEDTSLVHARRRREG